MSGRVVRIVGVYNADGSVVGELSYVVGRFFGKAHCALCDITHGRLRERAAWRACRDEVGVPVVTFHRDDRPSAVRAAASDTPVVLAETDDGTFHRLLSGDDLDRCAGSPDRLIDAIRESIARRGLEV